MKRILIVEDEAVALLAVKLFLETNGYQCSTASTAEEAVQKAREVKPDFILMDINLSDSGDGIETASRILDFLDTRICFISGYSEKSVSTRAQKLNPLAILDKPVALRRLLSILEEASNAQ